LVLLFGLAWVALGFETAELVLAAGEVPVVAVDPPLLDPALAAPLAPPAPPPPAPPPPPPWAKAVELTARQVSATTSDRFMGCLLGFEDNPLLKAIVPEVSVRSPG